MFCHIASIEPKASRRQAAAGRPPVFPKAPFGSQVSYRPHFKGTMGSWIPKIACKQMLFGDDLTFVFSIAFGGS